VPLPLAALLGDPVLEARPLRERVPEVLPEVEGEPDTVRVTAPGVGVAPLCREAEGLPLPLRAPLVLTSPLGVRVGETEAVVVRLMEVVPEGVLLVLPQKEALPQREGELLALGEGLPLGAPLVEAAALAQAVPVVEWEAVAQREGEAVEEAERLGLPLPLLHCEALAEALGQGEAVAVVQGVGEDV
jgi:hypothetical protein